MVGGGTGSISTTTTVDPSTTTASASSNSMDSNIGLVASIPKPRTAQEELGRFAMLASNFRQAAVTTQQGSVDFCKDMLPINYQTDTTKFCAVICVFKLIYKLYKTLNILY
jgi:hypothetical protein